MTIRTGLAVIGPMALAFFTLGAGRAPQAQEQPAPRFLRDVAPILDKKGCSTAGCHGKFGGRGGFALSLLTLSPADDHEPIVRGARGRRVNLLEPEKSLLLLKATGTVGHAGGARFSVGSPEYRTIRDWIAAGAPFDPQNEPQLASLSVTPAQVVLPKVGARVPLKVVATFTDGVRRDVTAQASYESSDTAIAVVDENGVATGKRWGGTAVVVRYLGTVEASSVILPRADKAPYPKLAASNFIDTLIQANLRKMNVAPSRLTTDTEFLRRLSLDLRGKLPEPAEVESFLKDTSADRRARIIDVYLDSPEFVDLRALRLSDMLRIHPRNLGNNISGERGAALFTEWVRDCVAQNLPYDRFARDLIVARGSTLRNGPTNFYRIDRTPEDRMETVAQAFLGQRMACARCHKHPFDRWTTDNYWNFAAFLGKVGIRNGALDGEQEIFYNPGGRVINQSVTGRRGKEATPTLLGDERALPVRPTEDSLARFADWSVSRDNPYFAKATVNRIWSHYLGRGVIHPVDDMRATTPPSVPGLLEALAADFVAHNYDTKHLIKQIVSSRTYQTASEPTAANALDDSFFSHFLPRPMLGQVLLDSINQATNNVERFGDFPPEVTAKQLTLPVGSYFLDTFGRSHREFLAELEPKVEPTLVQTLHILNSPYIDNKVKSRGGTVANLLSDKTVTNEQAIRELYLKTLCRQPTAGELRDAMAYIVTSGKRDEAFQDLMWALISAREFYFVS